MKRIFFFSFFFFFFCCFLLFVFCFGSFLPKGAIILRVNVDNDLAGIMERAVGFFLFLFGVCTPSGGTTGDRSYHKSSLHSARQQLIDNSLSVGICARKFPKGWGKCTGLMPKSGLLTQNLFDYNYTRVYIHSYHYTHSLVMGRLRQNTYQTSKTVA